VCPPVLVPACSHQPHTTQLTAVPHSAFAVLLQLQDVWALLHGGGATRAQAHHGHRCSGPCVQDTPVPHAPTTAHVSEASGLVSRYTDTFADQPLLLLSHLNEQRYWRGYLARSLVWYIRHDRYQRELAVSNQVGGRPRQKLEVCLAPLNCCAGK
jgi:hypothetical protein